MAATKARIIQTFAEPSRDRMAEMTLLSVFELMQDHADETAAAIRGDRASEMERALRAIGAAECLGDRSRKWL
jgi:hypothetical protein